MQLEPLSGRTKDKYASWNERPQVRRDDGWFWDCNVPDIRKPTNAALGKLGSRVFAAEHREDKKARRRRVPDRYESASADVQTCFQNGQPLEAGVEVEDLWTEGHWIRVNRWEPYVFGLQNAITSIGLVEYCVEAMRTETGSESSRQGNSERKPPEGGQDNQNLKVDLVVRWFYHHEEAARVFEGWNKPDHAKRCRKLPPNELLLSNHIDVVPASSILCSCAVYFLGQGRILDDTLPRRCTLMDGMIIATERPGYICRHYLYVSDEPPELVDYTEGDLVDETVRQDVERYRQRSLRLLKKSCEREKRSVMEAFRQLRLRDRARHSNSLDAHHSPDVSLVRWCEVGQQADLSPGTTDIAGFDEQIPVGTQLDEDADWDSEDPDSCEDEEVIID